MALTIPTPVQDIRQHQTILWEGEAADVENILPPTGPDSIILELTTYYSGTCQMETVELPLDTTIYRIASI